MSSNNSHHYELESDNSESISIGFQSVPEDVSFESFSFAISKIQNAISISLLFKDNSTVILSSLLSFAKPKYYLYKYFHFLLTLLFRIGVLAQFLLQKPKKENQIN